MESNPLKWHGGKSYLAKRIIELMPKHKHYVEPFFGGGAVLFAKSCEGVSEVVNDLNGELINFWRVLQHGISFEKFCKLINVVPFAQEEFERSISSMEAMAACFTPARIPDGIEKTKRAAYFFIRYRMSRQGLGKDFATLSRNRTRRGMNEQVSSWLSAIEGLPEAHERLKRVVILNDDACKVIRQQDGENTLYYLDPPYLHETRVTTGDYECEMSQRAHAVLLATLSPKVVADRDSFIPWSGDETWEQYVQACNYEFKGKFILSGYPSCLYDDWAAFMGWKCVEIEIDNKASSKKTKDKETECLWMNF